MYLLVFDLTENLYAAIASGMIFGFFPWRFAHAAHIQLQMAQGIPLTFLYLHRFFRNRSYKNALLFTLFFIMQFMSCGYYGIYLVLFVCLLISLTLFQRISLLSPWSFPWDYLRPFPLSVFFLSIILTLKSSKKWGLPVTWMK